MIFSLSLVLFFLFPNAISAWDWETGISTFFKGALESDTFCTLKIPESVTNQREALGDPLRIYIDINVVGVRDIPNQGGSLGLDIR